MNSTTDTPLPPPPPPAPRRLTRSSRDRMVGGVSGGIGRYFGIDSTLVRIGFVALTLLGGTGLLIYAAALLLVPLDEEGAADPATARDRGTAIGIAVVLIIGGLVLGSFGFVFGGALVPIGFLLLAGLAVWWLVTGERPSGSAGDVARRAALGVALLMGCGALAVASFFASGLGGGIVVAGIVIAAGAALVAAAFVSRARWLVLPALAIAMPLAFVSAANIDLDGGFGDRSERPGSLAELKDDYRLGAGELVVDLRNVDMPAGDHPVHIQIGAGHARVIVSEDVCVASKADVGMGQVTVFDQGSGGIDVDWNDSRRAPANTPRLVIDGDVGLGLLEVRHANDDRHGPGWERGASEDERNSACTAS